MATKKKAARKTAAKLVAKQIVIQGDGTPDELNTALDPNGKKHPAQVYWQALDVTQRFKISLDDPPMPFDDGNGPFPTRKDGTTKTLTADNFPNGTYGYHIDMLMGPNKWKRLAGGGIIIED